MIALIAGTGGVPGVLAHRLIERGEVPLICAMAGFAPDVPDSLEQIEFRLEQLGSLLADLRARGVSRICMAGLMRRPVLDLDAVDDATVPLIATLQRALPQGDDGTLRAITRLLERQGFTIIGASDIAPDLLVPLGIPTRAQPGPDIAAALPLARATLAAMGRADTGQACVLRDGQVIAREGPEGTDAMLAGISAGQGGFLYKGPKPGQELRVDMPAIGPETARGVARAGLDGIVAVAGLTLQIERDEMIHLLDASGKFLWGVEA